VCPAWAAHDPRDSFLDAPCERCGAAFAYHCYLAHVATAAEVARAEDPDDEMEGSMFLCRGCRS